MGKSYYEKRKKINLFVTPVYKVIKWTKCWFSDKIMANIVKEVTVQEVISEGEIS